MATLSQVIDSTREEMLWEVPSDALGPLSIGRSTQAASSVVWIRRLNALPSPAAIALAKRLRHSQVMTVLALSTDGQSAAAISEFFPAVSLWEVVQLCRRAKRHLSVSVAAKIVHSALSLICALRADSLCPVKVRGPDLLTDTIWVDSTGNVLLSEVGLACELAASDPLRFAGAVNAHAAAFLLVELLGAGREGPLTGSSDAGALMKTLKTTQPWTPESLLHLLGSLPSASNQLVAEELLQVVGPSLLERQSFQFEVDEPPSAQEDTSRFRYEDCLTQMRPGFSVPPAAAVDEPREETGKLLGENERSIESANGRRGSASSTVAAESNPVEQAKLSRASLAAELHALELALNDPSEADEAGNSTRIFRASEIPPPGGTGMSLARLMAPLINLEPTTRALVVTAAGALSLGLLWATL